MAATEPTLEAGTMRKVVWRLVPFLMISYIVAFVDRVNAGFAALQMNHNIGLTSAQFGLGAGIFFISYVLFEVPSNLAMVKVGPRFWIARIMITWGIVSTGMALVSARAPFTRSDSCLAPQKPVSFPASSST